MIFKDKLLRSITIISVAAVIIFPIYTVLFIAYSGEQGDRLISLLHAVLFAVSLALLALVVISVIKANKNIAARRQAEERLVRQSSELETTNAELSALYEVSSAISRTIDMDKLLTAVLDAVTRLKIIESEQKGAIFIVEENKLKLVSRLGPSEAFPVIHRDLEIGECLCGLAVRTGELVISKNSDADAGHTITYPGMPPHGHICIPLKATNRPVGVLSLYLKPDFEIDESKKKMLLSIGSQIGIAIENARLYEETKLLSLHDPLTGLANRRLMQVVLNSGYAKARRYGSPLSAIMLDIDYFKKYNDTFGHVAGDSLLVDIAKIILDEVRAVDLVVRYGGEEFLILLPETDSTKACEVAERIRKTVAAEKAITVSLGVSTFKPGMHREELIQKADDALYKAKQAGRNRMCVDPSAA